MGKLGKLIVAGLVVTAAVAAGGYAAGQMASDRSDEARRVEAVSAPATDVTPSSEAVPAGPAEAAPVAQPSSRRPSRTPAPAAAGEVVRPTVTEPEPVASQAAPVEVQGPPPPPPAPSEPPRSDAPAVQTAQERAVDFEQAKPRFEEITVRIDSVIGIKLDSTVSSASARVEDLVTAKVARDVTVGDRVAIPAGTKLEGTVTSVERGGRFKERPRLGVRFHALLLADGTRVNMDTETIFREGQSPIAASSAKVGGGAVAGAILGGLLGGKKGAIVGGATGAAGGVAAVATGDPRVTVIMSGTPLTVRLTSPLTVTIERF